MLESVQFDEDTSMSSRRRDLYVQQKSKIFKLLESIGVPERYVDYVLIGIIIVAAILSFFVFKIADGGTKTKIEVPPGNRLIDTTETGKIPPRLEFPIN